MRVLSGLPILPNLPLIISTCLVIYLNMFYISGFAPSLWPCGLPCKYCIEASHEEEMCPQDTVLWSHSLAKVLPHLLLLLNHTQWKMRISILRFWTCNSLSSGQAGCMKSHVRDVKFWSFLMKTKWTFFLSKIFLSYLLLVQNIVKSKWVISPSLFFWDT